MELEWRAFPTWWVRQHLLKTLGAGEETVGTNVAALKVFLALVIASDVDMLAEISLTQLQVLTGLSRPMVLVGVKQLVGLGIVVPDKSAYRAVYHLVQAEGQRHWMKAPIKVVRAHLKTIPNAGQTALAAMKIYLVLLTVRQRKSHEAPISHKSLQKYTGIRPGLIAKGVSLLVASDLVRFTNTMPRFSASGHPINNYYLYGKFVEGTDSAEDEVEQLVETGED